MTVQIVRLGGNVVSMPLPWANVRPNEGKWSYWLTVSTDSYPVDRSEIVLIDPDAELEDGCIVVMMFAGSVPRAMSYFLDEGRGYRGRFVKKGSDDETFTLDGVLRCSRRDGKNGRVFRFLGRVVGEPRRLPRYQTWDDPDHLY